jgi:hypothetical protein
MNVKNKVTHEHRISAEFDEFDIRMILTEKLAQQEGFEIDPRKTLISVRFDSRDKGSQGFKTFVLVEMVNDLTPKDEQD